MLRSLLGHVETKIAFVAILLTCLCAGTAFGFYQHLIGLHVGTEQLSEAFIRTRHIAITMSLLQDAETGQRGYLLTGREAYLEPYNRARAQIDASLARLQSDYPDHDLAGAVAASFDSHARAKLVELNETIDLRRRSGLEAAQRVVLQDTGKHLMDEVRAAGEQLLTAERAAVDRGIAQQRAAARSSLNGWTSVTAAVLLIIGLCLLLAFRDMKRGRRDRVRLRHVADHDALTGLLNRAGLLDRLAGSLSERPKTTGLLYLDLDGFKRVNDNLGHATGDRVLIEVARCLDGIVRPMDAVARLGGDEFVVIVERCEGPDALVDLSGRIEAAIGMLRVPGAETYPIGCSIGRAFSATDGRHPARLLEVADQAMYARKAKSKQPQDAERRQLSLVS